MKTLNIMTAIALLAPSFAFAEEGNVLSAEGGRYVFGQISDARRDQFMLDTATGRLWRVVCDRAPGQEGSADSCRTVLEQVNYWDGVFEKVAPYQGGDKPKQKPKQ